MRSVFSFALTVSVALAGLALQPAFAQDAAPAPAAVSSTNSVEITDQALRQLVAVLSSPDLTAESALAAFETANMEMDKAIMLARLDIAQARRDLDAYTKAGKADDMDDLLDKASNKKLQKLLNENEDVAKAFVDYIRNLGTFDRILNGSLQ